MNFDGYIPVDERLRRALATFPELRVQELDAQFEDTPSGMMLICRVSVWRTPDDPIPTIASVAEPYPGRTPYTKNSERAVGFTSALGRALGYMGFGIEKGIASRNEVQARVEDQPTDWEPSAGQVTLLRTSLGYTGPMPTDRDEFNSLVTDLKEAKRKAAIRKTDDQEEPF